MEYSGDRDEPAPAEVAVQHSTYPPETQGLMQTLLFMLADIDFEHESEISRLEQSPAHEDIKRRLRAKLREEHRIRREPYLRHLAQLHLGARPRSRSH